MSGQPEPAVSRPDSADRRVVVVGATSIVGHFLLQRLVATAYEVDALSRRGTPRDFEEHAGAAACTWHQLDVTRDIARWNKRATCLIHLAPLWLLPAALPTFAGHGVRRVIAFSSTSRFTKGDSPSAQERALAARLAQAEQAVAQRCDDLSVAWTLFRPTMIYGAGLDKNVSFIAAFIRRFGFFPISGAGGGRRQPVHADDLASACLAAIDHPGTSGRSYNLSGGDTLTYREMVHRVFVGSGRRQRTIRVPARLVAAALASASRLPGLSHLDPAMAVRVEADLSFDHSEATADFGFRARPFSFPG